MLRQKHRGAHRGSSRVNAQLKHARSRQGQRRRRTKSLLGEKDSMSGRAARALGWNFGSTILTKIALFGISIMLARLLGPHVFGTYAVAYVALTALLTFNELGVSLAIVRWEGDPGEIAPTVTTISVLVSIAIFIGCFFSAPLYTSAMGAPAATDVIRVLALCVLSDGFTNTPVALLQRSFRQDRKVISDQINVWLATVVTIALAWIGYGVMSLAIGYLVGCVAQTIALLLFAPESLRFGFRLARARTLLRFGMPLAGANIIAFAITNVDNIIVGHMLGSVALGFYVLALNIAGWPTTMFSTPVRTVAPAVFSRLQNDDVVIRTTFVSAAGLLAAVSFPVCLLLSGSAKPIVDFVYGLRWLPAAHALMWLALLGAVQILLQLSYDYFVAIARSRFILIVQAIWLLALIPALIAGAHAYGLYGAALAELAVATLIVLPCYLAELGKAGIVLSALGGRLKLPMAGAALTGLAGFGATRLPLGDFATILVSGAATVVILGALLYFMREAFAVLRSPYARVHAAAPTHVTTAPFAPGSGKIAEGSSTTTAGIEPAVYRHADGTSERPMPRAARQSEQPTRPNERAPRPVHPVHRDSANDTCLPQTLDATSPLYLRTVASLRWDPARTNDRGESLNLGGSPDRELSTRGLPRALALLVELSSGVE
jgi:O-antigen/teichoic acid export membrane protein